MLCLIVIAIHVYLCLCILVADVKVGREVYLVSGMLWIIIQIIIHIGMLVSFLYWCLQYDLDMCNVLQLRDNFIKDHLFNPKYLMKEFARHLYFQRLVPIKQHSTRSLWNGMYGNAERLIEKQSLL